MSLKTTSHLKPLLKTSILSRSFIRFLARMQLLERKKLLAMLSLKHIKNNQAIIIRKTNSINRCSWKGKDLRITNSSTKSYRKALKCHQIGLQMVLLTLKYLFRTDLVTNKFKIVMNLKNNKLQMIPLVNIH